MSRGSAEATFTGHVYVSGTVTPIPNVQVMLNDITLWDAGGHQVYDQLDVGGQTDANGRYVCYTAGLPSTAVKAIIGGNSTFIQTTHTDTGLRVPGSSNANVGTPDNQVYDLLDEYMYTD